MPSEVERTYFSPIRKVLLVPSVTEANLVLEFHVWITHGAVVQGTCPAGVGLVCPDVYLTRAWIKAPLGVKIKAAAVAPLQGALAPRGPGTLTSAGAPGNGISGASLFRLTPPGLRRPGQ